MVLCSLFFFFQAEDGIRYLTVTGVQSCALPISRIWGGLIDLPAGRAGEADGAGVASRVAAVLAGLGGEDQVAVRPDGVYARRIVDRKSVVKGKSADLGGRRIIKKKKLSLRKT